jgi:hypothetical protein
MSLRHVDGKVLVAGEGPLAANAVEHALRCGATSVTWVGRPLEMARTSFPISKRYDSLIRNAEIVRQCALRFEGLVTANRWPDISTLTSPMAPIKDNLTIILGSISGVRITFATVVAQDPFPLLELGAIAQKIHTTREPHSAMFDVLVVSASSENTDSERRSAAHLLRSIPKQISFDSPLIPISKFEMFVGLQVPDGSLRVLGSASRNQYLTGRLRSVSEEAVYKQWCASLCGQTLMPLNAMGITVGAATIAMATDYYSPEYPDDCVQTALLPPGSLQEKRRRTAEPLTLKDVGPASYTEFPRAG